MYNNGYNRTPLIPQCNAKGAPIPVMPNYDPPTAQHDDHSQMYHSRNIMESHDQIGTTKHIHVSIQQTYNN